MKFLHLIRLRDIIDVLLITVVLYRLMLLLKGTRAVKILIGLGILFIVSLFSTYIGLYTIDWILQTFLANIIVALIILFHPEIRRALARVGEISFISSRSSTIDFSPDFKKTLFRVKEIPSASSHFPTVYLKSLEEIILAASKLSSNKRGALIVIEKETSLEDFIEIGTILESRITVELILSIFQPTSPIHDGAVVIKENKIFAAGCFLPLTSRTDISPSFGTRHRAGIGIADETDAVVLIISEETGEITVVVGSRLEKNINIGSLRALLINMFASHRR